MTTETKTELTSTPLGYSSNIDMEGTSTKYFNRTANRKMKKKMKVADYGNGFGSFQFKEQKFLTACVVCGKTFKTDKQGVLHARFSHPEILVKSK